jgi:hypothetical protein
MANKKEHLQEQAFEAIRNENAENNPILGSDCSLETKYKILDALYPPHGHKRKTQGNIQKRKLRINIPRQP